MSKIGRFIDYLTGLERRHVTGAMAALRCGLTEPPGYAVEMYPYVAGWASSEPTRWREDMYYLVASLYALHPTNWSRGEERSYTNFGASFACIAAGDDYESVERRFCALLRAGRDDLHVHLRHAVRLLKSRDVPIDWQRLLDDLVYWEDDDGRVLRNWARAFYMLARPENVVVHRER